MKNNALLKNKNELIYEKQHYRICKVDVLRVYSAFLKFNKGELQW